MELFDTFVLNKEIFDILILKYRNSYFSDVDKYLSKFDYNIYITKGKYIDNKSNDYIKNNMTENSLWWIMAVCYKSNFKNILRMLEIVSYKINLRDFYTLLYLDIFKKFDIITINMIMYKLEFSDILVFLYCFEQFELVCKKDEMNLILQYIYTNYYSKNYFCNFNIEDSLKCVYSKIYFKPIIYIKKFTKYCSIIDDHIFLDKFDKAIIGIDIPTYTFDEYDNNFIFEDYKCKNYYIFKTKFLKQCKLYHVICKEFKNYTNPIKDLKSKFLFYFEYDIYDKQILNEMENYFKHEAKIKYLDLYHKYIIKHLLLIDKWIYRLLDNYIEYYMPNKIKLEDKYVVILKDEYIKLSKFNYYEYYLIDSIYNYMKHIEYI